MVWLRRFWVLLTMATLTACAFQPNRETIRFNGLDTPPKGFSGKLTLPEGDRQRVPAVILVHGTAGPDSRYGFHRPALLASGIATFEVDFKSNVFKSGSDRPAMKTFHPWVFGALQKLRSNPDIDPARIAIMGFSLGGHLSVSVASQKVVTEWLGRDQQGFAAHVGFYPACNWLKKNFDSSGATGAPILILSAEKDSWGDGEACQPFCDWLNDMQPGVVFLKMYPGAHHGFDRRGSSQGFAPYAKDKIGILQWNKTAAHDSRERAIAFLRQAFGL